MQTTKHVFYKYKLQVITYIELQIHSCCIIFNVCENNTRVEVTVINECRLGWIQFKIQIS